jgi:hypothetical protein
MGPKPSLKSLFCMSETEEQLVVTPPSSGLSAKHSSEKMLLFLQESSWTEGTMRSR